jgi:hypothetical protein
LNPEDELCIEFECTPEEVPIVIHYIEVWIVSSTENLEDITTEVPLRHPEDSLEWRPNSLVGCTPPNDTPPDDSYICVSRVYEEMVEIYTLPLLPGD